MLATERNIAATASALIKCHPILSRTEAELVEDAADLVDPAVVSAVRDQIKDGLDPLGEALCQVRSAKLRRASGAVYTPFKIIEAIASWLTGQTEMPARIVDPGSGSGRFLMVLAPKFPNAILVAVEPDPLSALVLRANAETMGFSHRLDVRVEDYCNTDLPHVAGKTAFVGNPPYVRHHDISASAKNWLVEASADLGLKANQLSGLHVYFFLKTAQLAAKGDFGAFLTSAEWLDTNYGATLRTLLTKKLMISSLQVLEPKLKVFPDAISTAAITCFSVGTENTAARLCQIDDVNMLDGLVGGKSIPLSEIQSASRWLTLIRPSQPKPAGYIELGEIFRVHRGQVTGANNVWISEDNPFNIPEKYLVPTVTKAKELISAGETLSCSKGLKRVVDLPIDLASIEADEQDSVDSFLRWAETQKANDTFVAKNCKSWWSVGLKSPPPVICTYMARRAPAFVRNLCNARILNIAHGMYPRDELDDAVLENILTWLRQNVRMELGRVYAGGLAKFEPKEVERLTMPPLSEISQLAAA